MVKVGWRILLALVAAAPVPAVAQDEPSQTPENAQRFFALVARDYQLIAERAGDGEAIKARVVATDYSDVCSTRLTFGDTSVRRGFFGFSFVPDTQRIAGTRVSGARLSSITPGLAAAKGGLAAGDLIVSLKGEPVTEKSDLAQMISRIPAGQMVDIGIYRAERPMTLRIAPGTRPDEPDYSPTWVRLVRTADETPVAAGPATIDWGRTAVSEGDAGSFAMLTAGKVFMRLRLDPPNTGMEKRLLYALRFLRESCDETAGTGF